MNTISLNRQEVKDRIADDYLGPGDWVMVVYPTATYRIYWHHESLPRDHDKAAIGLIVLPSLNREGTGDEWLRAQDLLERRDPKWLETREYLRAFDIPVIDYVAKSWPAQWAQCNLQALDWLADAFLAACNGNGEDLNRIDPWGRDAEWLPIAPPAQFTWTD